MVRIRNEINFETWYFEDWHHYDKKRIPIRRLYSDVLKWANEFTRFNLLDGRGKTSLDVGCAHAYMVELLTDLGYKAYGCDLSRLYLAKYAKRVTKDLVLCDAQKLPFHEESFDIITAMELIEHLGNQDEFLHNCFKCMKPKGALVLQTPKETPSISGLLSRIYAKVVSKSSNVEQHVNALVNTSDLTTKLSHNGFISYVETWYLLPLDATILGRYFPTRVPIAVPTFRAIAFKQD